MNRNLHKVLTFSINFNKLNTKYQASKYVEASIGNRNLQRPQSFVKKLRAPD